MELCFVHLPNEFCDHNEYNCIGWENDVVEVTWMTLGILNEALCDSAKIWVNLLSIEIVVKHFFSRNVFKSSQKIDFWNQIIWFSWNGRKNSIEIVHRHRFSTHGIEHFRIFSFTNPLQVVHSIPAHWVWSDHGFFYLMGVIDSAGCSVVSCLHEPAYDSVAFSP